MTTKAKKERSLWDIQHRIHFQINDSEITFSDGVTMYFNRYLVLCKVPDKNLRDLYYLQNRWDCTDSDFNSSIEFYFGERALDYSRALNLESIARPRYPNAEPALVYSENLQSWLEVEYFSSKITLERDNKIIYTALASPVTGNLYYVYDGTDDIKAHTILNPYFISNDWQRESHDFNYDEVMSFFNDAIQNNQ